MPLGKKGLHGEVKKVTKKEVILLENIVRHIIQIYNTYVTLRLVNYKINI